ncbi:MAG TPA: patatin-like phospholipase family protein [Stellaceae bacterium]|nr:patatin-like phospholipase family protein [Stellaceae bacterium]
MNGAERPSRPAAAEHAAGGYRVPVPSPSILDGLDRDARRALEGEMEWLCLPGGQILFSEGEAPDALYLVLAGALAISAGKPREHGTMLGQIGVGETVGEMGLLSERPRSATVVALRDCSLLRIGKQAFETFIRLHPTAALRFLAQLVDRLEQTTRGTRGLFVPTTLALVPLDAAVPTEELAERLAEAVSRLGLKVSILGETQVAHTEDYFHAVESAHDLTIYRGDSAGVTWVPLCIRRADHLLLLATGRAPSCNMPVLSAEKRPPWRVAELVLLADDGGARQAATPWLTRLPVQGHYHLRRHSQADIARLARCVTGRAVGLVLSGGGARGFGHIGVIKALRASGIPLDLLGGTSIGAIIAAGAALEWEDDEFDTRMRRAFVESNPLDDYTFPFVALTKGHKVSARLREHFGESRIEDLWRPYFCVASNLTTGEVAVLRHGVLWHALRASIAIPGLLPPFIENGAVLSDGAVLNNLPADIMATMRRGPVVGVDVTHYHALQPQQSRPPHWLRRLLGGSDHQGPGIATMLMTAANLGSDAQTRLSRAHVDVLLEPPLAIGIRDWRAYDQAVAAGYRYAMERMADIDNAIRAATASGRAEAL